MTIYVGNLSRRSSEDDLITLFTTFGEVKSAKIIMDNFTGQSKGFAFVEMDNSGDAEKAIEALHDTEFMERTLTVNEAKPKTFSDRPRTSGGGNFGGGNSYGGGSGGNRGGSSSNGGGRGGYSGGNSRY